MKIWLIGMALKVQLIFIIFRTTSFTLFSWLPKFHFMKFLEREVVVIKTIHEIDPSLEKTTTRRSKDGGVAIHTFQIFLLVPIK